MDYKTVRNLSTMFFDQAEIRNTDPFLWHKREGVYRSQSYGEIANQISLMARGLRSLGIEPGDKVVIISENRPEWVIADIAIGAIGAITVPAYVTNTSKDHLFILNNSAAKAAIVSTSVLIERTLPAVLDSKFCGILIAMEPKEFEEDIALENYLWEEVLELGRTKPDDIREKANLLGRDDISCFIYTSGTGGNPKGVMLTHGSIIANCYAAFDLLTELGLGEEIFLSLLPLSHSYEHTCGLYFPISIGAQIYYAEGPDKVAQNLKEARPTIMTAVPRLYEVLHDRIRRGVEQTGGIKKALFLKALELGKKRYNNPAYLTLFEKVYDKLLERAVRRKVAERFGGRLKTFVSGGAALNPDIGKFFISLGINILQGYGQTEASPVISCNRPAKNKIETVGPALAGVEMKIADDGEILVRGELVMKGYWNDKRATGEAIINDWLHTGDIGSIDSDGYLTITDRKKDIIVNSGGDNIAPTRVEGIITLETEIAQAMVYGDKKPYLVAVVVPSEEFMADWVNRAGKETDLSILSGDKDFNKNLVGVMNRINANLSQLEKVRKIVIAAEPFTTENEMLTPTLKIRRHKIKESYGNLLDNLYR